MEQLTLLNIIRTDTAFRFHLDLPDGSAPSEYTTELTTELSGRLRRALQGVSQQMQTSEIKTQIKRSGVNDTVHSLGRLLFESFVPLPIQENLRRLESPLLISTNTPEIPWELMY